MYTKNFGLFLKMQESVQLWDQPLTSDTEATPSVTTCIHDSQL